MAEEATAEESGPTPSDVAMLRERVPADTVFRAFGDQVAELLSTLPKAPTLDEIAQAITVVLSGLPRPPSAKDLLEIFAKIRLPVDLLLANAEGRPFALTLGSVAGQPVTASLSAKVGGDGTPLAVGPLRLEVAPLRVEPNITVGLALFGIPVFSLRITGDVAVSTR